MATDRANVADIRQPRKQLRPRRQIEQMSFPRSALQTSPPDDCISTKICTTCTYYREILSLRTLRSGRTIEYFVLMNLRTIEKRKDWIWIGFQSGPPFFVRTIENYVLLSVRTIEKWLYVHGKRMILWQKNTPLDLSFWSFLTFFAPWYRRSRQRQTSHMVLLHVRCLTLF